MYLGDTFTKWTPAKPCRQIPPIQNYITSAKKVNMILLTEKKELLPWMIVSRDQGQVIIWVIQNERVLVILVCITDVTHVARVIGFYPERNGQSIKVLIQCASVNIVSLLFIREKKRFRRLLWFFVFTSCQWITNMYDLYSFGQWMNKKWS